MQKISFILNGRLRSKARLRYNINQRLLDQFLTCIYETISSGDATHLAQHAIEDKTDYLIAAGGDGMLNEVVNGYMNSDEALRKNVILGLLPCGTGNDFARTIGMRNDIEQLASLIENDQTQPVDIGEIQYKSLMGVTKTRYYINITDIGIGGLVVKTVNESSKFLGPNLTYLKATIQAFFSYKHSKVRLTSDSFQWEGPILSLCMANGRYFGSGICIAPQAEVSDGKIQLVILGNVSLMDYLKNMSKIKKGEILEHPEILYEQVRSCRIESIDGECPVDMDGEFIGYTPVELNIKEHVLTFLR